MLKPEKKISEIKYEMKKLEKILSRIIEENKFFQSQIKNKDNEIRELENKFKNASELVEKERLLEIIIENEKKINNLEIIIQNYKNKNKSTNNKNKNKKTDPVKTRKKNKKKFFKTLSEEEKHQLYNAETGKTAIWHGKITKIYKNWVKSKNSS